MLKKIKVFKDKRGQVIKMINRKDKFFKKFGEIYFSTILPGKIKAWRKHKKNTCNLMLLKGNVVIKLIKNNKIITIKLTERKKKLLRINRNIWFGIKNIGKVEGIIVNLIDNIHNDNEVERLKTNYFKKIIWKKI
tara:strand:+ start:215 stop:619 length:405 start_codon:yes stop_codon:yes gene_type:complete